MSLIYADSSALVRAYFPDEPDHADLRTLLLEGNEAVVTSEIARLELASAARGASSGGRLSRWSELLARIDVDLAEGGPIGPIGLRPDLILPAAYRLVVEHRLRTLDAIHLAVCVEECPAFAGDDTIIFVTRDREQAAAARALGLETG
ncbi:MAG: type II toxin-antitoxin system VapC family toxin [Chloroflexi bacterium]|nr:MAG: type II toxin-antitoxin system VapC family toxin [Chloroflexota bacterium]TME87375.1 MAG: type II toxin-antitoxin system VapC family toxin [Chloroflexota bacterium]